MRCRNVYLFGLMLIVCLPGMVSGKEKKYDINGYVSTLPALNWNSDTAFGQGLVHNRINIKWYPTKNITGSLQIRNQLIVSNFFDVSDITDGFTEENYAMPLTFQHGFDSSSHTMLSASIDRVWLQYTHNNLEVKLGRQRINWGQTFVWNPNNIFNTYNFFDFDYPERPGADAVRVIYYPNYNSTIELATKVDSAGNITGAGLYKFTKWNVEMQFMAGYYSNSNKLQIADNIPPYTWDDEDLVGGFGFSGGIGSVSIRGEGSYLYSVQEHNDSTNQFMGSVMVDYTLANELGMMFEFFYVDNVRYTGSLASLYGATQTIKTLAFTKYNAFAQLSYPIIPILTGSFGGMYFFDDNLQGFYAGPSLDLSLGDNLTMGSYFQLFAFHYENLNAGTKEWVRSNYAFLRLKWNF